MVTSPPIETTLRAHFEAARNERNLAKATATTAADRRSVRVYQQSRLAQTHADLLRSSKYGLAATFFLTELYSTEDLTQRDADLERVIKLLVKFTPEKALDALAAALEMDALSELLDGKLAAVLRSQQGPGAALRIDASTYAVAYRAMGQFDLRLRQVELTEEIGLALDKLARMPIVMTMLRVMRVPANVAGVGRLHEFLERGYAAFIHMNGGRVFIDTIVARERAEHERLTG